MLAFYLALIDDESDKRLFENLYYAHRKQMISMAVYILHNDDDAEDAVHEVFTLIASKYMDVVKSIELDEDLRNYLLKAVKNTSLNMLKKRKREVLSTDAQIEYSMNTMKPVSDDMFFEQICQKMDYDTVVQAIRSLDEIYRDVLYYHYVLGMPVSIVAKTVGRSVSTTKKQLVRGKKILLKLLGIEGDEEHGDNES